MVIYIGTNSSVSVDVNPNEYLVYNDILKTKAMSLEIDILSFHHSVQLSGLHSGQDKKPNWFMWSDRYGHGTTEFSSGTKSHLLIWRIISVLTLFPS